MDPRGADRKANGGALHTLAKVLWAFGGRECLPPNAGIGGQNREGAGRPGPPTG